MVCHDRSGPTLHRKPDKKKRKLNTTTTTTKSTGLSHTQECELPQELPVLFCFLTFIFAALSDEVSPQESENHILIFNKS